jgi:outer membrane protein, heavy metal efflux system
MKKNILLGLIMVMARAGWSAGPVVTNAMVVTPEYVNQLAEEMREQNPALQAARARTNAAAASVGAVRTWEDPMFMVGGMVADKEMRANDGDILYGVEQKLPLFGRPGLARKVALAESDVAVSKENAEFQVRRVELAVTLFRTALADRTVLVGEQDLRWLDTLESALEARYRSGAATLVEWTQVQNERSKRAAQLQTDRDQLTQQHVVLNRRLGRSLLQRWPALKLPNVAESVRFSPALLNFATRYEPRLHTMREEARAARAAADLTGRERLPEVSAGVLARNYSGNGEFRQGEIVLRLSLPWFNQGKYHSATRRDEARAKAAELDAADYAAGLREEVHGLTVKIEAARREALVYRDEIIPRSETAIESARAAWESGRGMFRDVLEARRMLLEARLMHARAVAEQYEMLSDLVLCCGLGDLEALKMLEDKLKTAPGEFKP